MDLTNIQPFQFGVNKIVPLKEKGESTQVTQENKREYVQLSAQYRLYSSIKDQIESLLGGFYEIIPKDLITIVGFLLKFLETCLFTALTV